MAKKIEVELWYTQAETADLLGVGKKALEAARTRGDGVPFTKLGRAVLYRGKDILACLEAGIRTSTAPRPGPRPMRHSAA